MRLTRCLSPPLCCVYAVLIDARQNMHQSHPSEPDSTYFQTALRVALAVMKNKVVMSTKHMVGIVFFGASGDAKEDDYQEEAVWAYQDLKVGAWNSESRKLLVYLMTDRSSAAGM
jgi:Ku70/Ku80 N-terminal alpha/beta domain